MQAAGVGSSTVLARFGPAYYNSNLPDKIYPLEQERHDCAGGNQLLYDWDLRTFPQERILIDYIL